MDRRDFIKVSAIGAASLACADLGFKAEAKKNRGSDAKAGSAYSVIVVGDTHYDKAPDGVYHEGYSDPNPKREADHRKEFGRNADMWADRSRRLLRRASKLRGEDTVMAFQLGDIIQGDCGNAENHKIMLDDAWCYIKGALGGLPLITVAGNHDLRGRDDSEATAAYTEYMTERMSSELDKTVTKTCFSFRIGEDAYIAVDFTHPDDEEIEKLFEETRGARYTFVIIHSPVLPYQHKTRANWIIHGRDGKPEARKRFRQLLAERDAIVICGHTHTTEFARWEGDGGSITQMTVSSVWSSEAAGKFKLISNSADDYGRLVEKEAKQPLVDLVREYKPGMKAFMASNSCGSYKLLVSDEGVSMEYYEGDSIGCTKVFKLR